MSSVGRWTVRDSSGRGWTFVSLSIARPDERERASPANAAAWTIDLVFGRDSNQDVLLQLAGVSASDARHYTRDRLKTLVKQRVGPLGPLLLLDDSGRSAGAGATSSAPTVLPERRVAEAIMARRSTITFSGHEYRVVAAFSATDLRDTGEFYVVRLAEARTVLARMSDSPVLGSAAQQEAAAEAIDLLVDDRQGAGTGGIFLLRRSSQTFYADAPVEPASTPSALRAAAKKDIKVTFIESPSGRPIPGAVVRLEAPGGSESRLTTADDGSIELTSLDPGTCFATSVIKDAKAAMSFVPGAPPPPPPVEAGAASGGSGGGATGAPGASSGATGAGGTTGASPATSGATSGAGSGGVRGQRRRRVWPQSQPGRGQRRREGVRQRLAESERRPERGGSLLGGGSAAPAAGPSALPGAGAPGGGAPGAPGAAGGAAPGAGGAAAPGAAAAPAPKPPTGPIGPGFLVTVETYRVKTGDTKESIARETQVAWDDIAKFNWGTTSDAELQEFFRDQVGCTKTTPDEESYIFDDSDEPGIIMVPHEWTSSFAVGEEHTVYVAPMRTVYITLENEAGLPVPGAAFEAVFVDGTVRKERLGRSGIARLTGVPDGRSPSLIPIRPTCLRVRWQHRRGKHSTTRQRLRCCSCWRKSSRLSTRPSATTSSTSTTSAARAWWPTSIRWSRIRTRGRR